LIRSPGIELDDLQLHLDALILYSGTRLHFVDCLIAASASARLLPVATFDSGFNKLPGVKVALD
jgi:predicted nucleic acid-binding protein